MYRLAAAQHLFYNYIFYRQQFFSHVVIPAKAHPASVATNTTKLPDTTMPFFTDDAVLLPSGYLGPVQPVALQTPSFNS
jgi:hypothetical protein